MVIAAINETLLTTEDKLLIRNYKIYRCNATIRRKGLAFLIRKHLHVQIEVIDCDWNGRYLRISLTDPNTRASRTFGTCYLELTFDQPDDFPDHVFQRFLLRRLKQLPERSL